MPFLKPASVVLLIASAIASPGASPVTAQEEPIEAVQQRELSAPVVYKNLMLIIQTKDGVAAVDFLDAIERGVTYRFRFLPDRGSMEVRGEGRVFERYKLVDGREVYD